MTFSEPAITAAAFYFESLRGIDLGHYERDAIREHALHEVDPEALAQDLRNWIESEPSPDGHLRSCAYWALGKRQDPAHLPFFRERLRVELQRDVQAVYQLLIALEDIGEEVLGLDRSSRGSGDDALNLRDAEAYLRRVA